MHVPKLFVALVLLMLYSCKFAYQNKHYSKPSIEDIQICEAESHERLHY